MSNPSPPTRSATDDHVRHPCRSWLKNPTYAAALPLFLTNAILPEAENGWSNESVLPMGMAYQAGVEDCQIVPPIAPPPPAAAAGFDCVQPKSCLIVGGSEASTRLFIDSQPGSFVKSSRTWTSSSCALSGGVSNRTTMTTTAIE